MNEKDEVTELINYRSLLGYVGPGWHLNYGSNLYRDGVLDERQIASAYRPNVMKIEDVVNMIKLETSPSDELFDKIVNIELIARGIEGVRRAISFVNSNPYSDSTFCHHCYDARHKNTTNLVRIKGFYCYQKDHNVICHYMKHAHSYSKAMRIYERVAAEATSYKVSIVDWDGSGCLVIKLVPAWMEKFETAELSRFISVVTKPRFRMPFDLPLTVVENRNFMLRCLYDTVIDMLCSNQGNDLMERIEQNQFSPRSQTVVTRYLPIQILQRAFKALNNNKCKMYSTSLAFDICLGIQLSSESLKDEEIDACHLCGKELKADEHKCVFMCDCGTVFKGSEADVYYEHLSTCLTKY